MNKNNTSLSHEITELNNNLHCIEHKHFELAINFLMAPDETCEQTVAAYELAASEKIGNQMVAELKAQRRIPFAKRLELVKTHCLLYFASRKTSQHFKENPYQPPCQDNHKVLPDGFPEARNKIIIPKIERLKKALEGRSANFTPDQVMLHLKSGKNMSHIFQALIVQ